MTASGASGRRLAFLLPDMGGGGAERVALKLMEDFLAAGHRVDLLLLRREGELLASIPAGVRLVDLAAPRLRQALRPLIRYLRETRPDALQASMWPLTIIAILARGLARSNAVLVVSDHIALSAQYAAPRITAWMLRLTMRLFYPFADARVAVSAEVAADLAELSGLGRDKFDIIYNPIPRPPPGHAPDAAVEALWGDTGAARILTAGRFKAQKNQALLLRAFARLRQARPARLILIGDGDLRPELEALARKLGIAGDVAMPGFVADPWPYYQSADLFVLSSNYEGFGNVLVEAMRCGLPVVSTDCRAGPREILADGDYGMLVPVGDEAALAGAMAAALDRPADDERLKRRAEALSGIQASERYLDLMLGRRKSPALA